MRIAQDSLDGENARRVYQKIFFSMGIKYQYPLTANLYLEALDTVRLGTVEWLNRLNFGFFVANALLLALLFGRLVNRLSHPVVSWTMPASVVIVALLYAPITIGLRIGQIQVALNTLFTLACLAILAGRTGIAGGIVAVAAAVKPQFGVLVLQAILLRDWRFVVAFLGAGSLLLSISIGLYGWSNHWDYLPVLSHLMERGEAYAWNNSFNGILNRLLETGPSMTTERVLDVWQSVIPRYDARVAVLTRLTSIAFLAIPIGVTLRYRSATSTIGGRLLLYLLSAICATMAAPIAWIHHYGILLPAFLVLALLIWDRRSAADRRRRLVWLALAFTLSAVSYPFFPWATGVKSLVLAPTFVGAVILLALMIGELASAAQRQSGSPDAAPPAPSGARAI